MNIKNSMMVKFFSVMAASIFLLFIFVSCNRSSEPKPDLVLWSGFGDQEYVALKLIIDEYNKEYSRNVSIVKVPFEELKIKYQVAAPAGQGPDLVTGPQDWVGSFAIAQLISPLSEEEFPQEQKDIYNPVGIEVLTYDEEIYGLPISLETLAIIYNKDLIEEEPQTMEELIEKAAAFNNPSEGKYGFFFELGNLYFSWAFLSGFNAKIFGEDKGKININEVLLYSPETLQGFEFLSSLRNQYRLIPDGATTDMMNGVFYNGNMMFCLNGPWMLGELKNKGMNFGVLPLPPLKNGRRPSPFVGVQGLLLNKMVKNRPLAIELMHYINTPENQKKLCLASGRIPSRHDTLNLIKDQTAMLKFAEAAQYGTPMPNHPALAQVWTPMGEALKLIIIDGHDPETVLNIQVKRIVEDIYLMME